LAILLAIRRAWPDSSLAAPPLIRPGEVAGFKKEEHERNFEKRKCRDEKLAHHQTHELN